MDKSTLAALATTTITVFTRHKPNCPKKADPSWKRCKCRKALYIYENGKDRRMSAKTKSWERAEELAKAELAKRDPVARRLREIEEQEAARVKAKAAKRTTICDALEEWRDRKGTPPISTASTHRVFARKVKAWALGQGITYMDEVTRRGLDQWKSKWSLNATLKDNRMGSRTAQQFQARLQEFFRWAFTVEIVDKDPSAAFERIKVTPVTTQPLTPAQFEELLAAVPKYDSLRKSEEDRRGIELRSLFLIMRWTGLRINDVLMLPRSALRGDRLRLVTKKTKAEYDERIPLDAIAAFAAIPPRPGVHPDYYFWSRTCTYRTLVATWCERIQQLNKFLTFQDEDGKPMPFRSHQLRDMFAIELLLRGVPMEDVSRMLTHKSIGVTEKHYAPFVKRRKQQLEAKRIAALEMMGATFSAQTGSPAMTAGPVLQA